MPTIGAPSPSQFDLHPINGTSVSMYSYSCGSTVVLAASMTPSSQTSNGGYNETTTCVMSGPLAAGQYLVGSRISSSHKIASVVEGSRV